MLISRQRYSNFRQACVFDWTASLRVYPVLRPTCLYSAYFDCIRLRWAVGLTRINFYVSATVEKRCQPEAHRIHVCPSESECLCAWVCVSRKPCQHHISKINEGNFIQLWSQINLGLSMCWLDMVTASNEHNVPDECNIFVSIWANFAKIRSCTYLDLGHTD